MNYTDSCASASADLSYAADTTRDAVSTSSTAYKERRMAEKAGGMGGKRTAAPPKKTGKKR